MIPLLIFSMIVNIVKFAHSKKKRTYLKKNKAYVWFNFYVWGYSVSFMIFLGRLITSTEGLEDHQDQDRMKNLLDFWIYLALLTLFLGSICFWLNKSITKMWSIPIIKKKKQHQPKPKPNKHDN